MAGRLQQFVESRGFHHFIVGVIFLSAILVGVEGTADVPARYGVVLDRAEQAIRALFGAELVLRVLAHGWRPWRFFRSGWNHFDFVIIALCFLPEAQFLAVLRLVRTLRVLRLVAPLHESEVIRQKNAELARAYEALSAEKAKSERLLLNVLPVLIARRLKDDTEIIADSFDDASVLFADIQGFTEFSRGVSAEQLVAMLDEIFSRFDRLVDRFGLEKIKTIGDAYMVVAGVPEPRLDHLEALATMALAMHAELADYNRATGRRLALRIGLHCGRVVAGVIGRKKFIYDLWGDTVNTASRMESHGVPGRIQVTDEAHERLRHKFAFEPRGVTEIKGKGPMRTYFLTGARAAG
jgi:class 3 adenylate cyclase